MAFLVVFTRVALLAWVYPEAERLYNGDSWLYEQYALSMLDTGEYLAQGYGTRDTNRFADMIRPPGLPVLLAAVYGVVGAQWGPWAMLLPSLAGNLAVLAIIWLFLRRMGLAHRWSYMLIFVLDPVWIMYSKELITEPYFTPLLLGSVYFAVIVVLRHRSVFSSEGDFTGGIPRWVGARGNGVLLGLSGLLLGVATLFKPITFFAPWLAVVLIPLAIWVRRSWDRTPRALAPSAGEVSALAPSAGPSKTSFVSDMRALIPALTIFLLLAQLPVAAWQLRNYAAHETFAFTAIAADNMMTGHAAFVVSATQGITHTQAITQIRAEYQRRNPEEDSYTFAMQSDAKMAIAREILEEHPWHYTVVVLRGMVTTLADPGRLVMERTFGGNDRRIGLTETLARDGLRGTVVRLVREQPTQALYYVGYISWLILLSACSVVGAWSLWRRNPALALILVAVLLYVLVLGSVGGYARFRMYVLPFLVLMAAAAFPCAEKSKV